jgi:hypothetical protein
MFTRLKLHNELRQLERKYNPQGVDLHFECLAFGDAELFPSLVKIARKGWRGVAGNGALRRGSSMPGGRARLPVGGFEFWYSLFQVTSGAAVRVAKDGAAAYVPAAIVKDFVSILVETARFTVADGGDLFKRNYEALAFMLTTFQSKDLVQFVRRHANKCGTNAKALVKVSLSAAKPVNSSGKSLPTDSLGSDVRPRPALDETPLMSEQPPRPRT